ncbi:MAG: hypothetical protein ABIW19_14535, partial [Vicinamibacterales bacterium]
MDLCSSMGNREEALSPSYCDGFYACGLNQYACSLSARVGFFRELYFRSCPFCQLVAPVKTDEAHDLVASVAPDASRVLRTATVGTTPVVSLPDLALTATGISRVSLGSDGAQAAAGGSIVPSLSADGRFVAFDSAATNLVPGDGNAKRDVFVHDRVTGSTSRVSISSAGATGNGDSISAALSADGRYVAFLSRATNLVGGDTNAVADVFVHDRQTGQTERVNVGLGGVEANQPSWPDGGLDWYAEGGLANSEVAISGDGRYVAFVSFATNLVSRDPNVVLTGVCVRDRQQAATRCIGAPTFDGAAAGIFRPSVSISADGRFVAFATTGKYVTTDSNLHRDVYLHDRVTAQTTRISVSNAGAQGDAASGWPSVSGDGRYVVFASDASNLIAGESNGVRRVYLYDRLAKTTRRLSESRSLQPSISSDGRFVVYSTFGLVQLFDAQTSSARSIGTDSENPDAFSFGAAISADGTTVAFGSAATNLVPGDTNGVDDVFVVPNAP